MTTLQEGEVEKKYKRKCLIPVDGHKFPVRNRYFRPFMSLIHPLITVASNLSTAHLQRKIYKKK